jgi:very-short-patch-repair endonuclease
MRNLKLIPAHVLFRGLLKDCKLPAPVMEYQFHPVRKWRFDFAWPEHKIALEVEGGVFGHKKKDGTKSEKGAHSSVSGILRDIEKYNAAACLGWRVLRVIPSELVRLQTAQLLKQCL